MKNRLAKQQYHFHQLYLSNFVLSFLRKTINTNDDVKNILNLTNLTTIPMISNSTHSSLLLSNPGIQYQIKHAFQELRLHVEQEKKKTK